MEDARADRSPGDWRAALPVSRGDGIRVARLGGLPPGVAVVYEVVAGGRRAGPWSFRTAPRPGAPDTVRVLLFGDSGWGSRAQVELARRMERTDRDLAIHVGDVAYQSGTTEDYTERHFRVYRPLLAVTPLFPAVGNHDLRTDDGGPYARAFAWPAPRPGAFWYTFRWGSVAFLALDTSESTEDGRELRARRGAQYAWLERTLREVAGDPGVDWTVVYMHYPVYSHAVGIRSHGPDLALRHALVPLFETYGVDLVAAGHDHHYERSVPLGGDRRVEAGCGPVYLVQGSGGASMQGRGVAASDLTADVASVHSFTTLTFAPGSATGRTIAADGTELDAFRLRPYPGPDAAGCAD